MFFPSFARGQWRVLPLFGLLLSLGGCNMAHQMPPAESSPTPRPKALNKSKPSAKPTPRLAPRRAAAIIYGVQTKHRVLALTFDDGPDPTWTPQVLAILQKHRVPATFFMVGTMVHAHPQFAKQVKDGNFPIGSHSWSHPSRPRNPRREIEMTDAILKKTLHITPTMFRPPYGIMSNGMAKIALSRRQDVIIWNSLGADWDKRVTASSIEAKVVHGASPGGICLLHDGGGNRRQTVAALPRIIDRLRRRGYRFVTVPELLKMGSPLHITTSTSPRHKRPEHARKRLVKSKTKTNASPKPAKTAAASIPSPRRTPAKRIPVHAKRVATKRVATKRPKATKAPN